MPKLSEELQSLVKFHESSEGKYAPTDDLAAFLWRNRMAVSLCLRAIEAGLIISDFRGEIGVSFPRQKLAENVEAD